MFVYALTSRRAFRCSPVARRPCIGHILSWLIVWVLFTGPALAVETIVTRDHVFYIPFTASAGASGTTLSLFVSGDAGATWQLYQQQPAEAGKFGFHAGTDGEFWFAVRVSNGNQSTLHESPEVPELKVAVDRQPPRLNLVGLRDANGRVICQWSLEDEHLEPQSLQIEYQLEGRTDWHPTLPGHAGSQPPTVGARSLLKGEVSIPAMTLGGPVRLRATARDRAGNEATIEREYDPAGLPLIQRSRSATDMVGAAPPFPHPERTEDRLPLSTAGAPPSMHGDSTHGWHVAPQQPVAGPPGLEMIARDAHPGLIEQEITSGKSFVPFPGARYQPHGDEDAMPTRTPDTITDRVHERISKSRRFEIDYDLEDVSMANIHRVEVWYTNDGGRTWRHHGDDEDRQSPYLMQVDQDGLYGIRLLIQTQVGYNVRPPTMGDPADVWIRVDATPPTVRITSVEYDQDDRASELEISWTAQDDNLADNPITLLFSDSPQGPWRRIANDLPNNGRYQWPVDDRAPTKIYLRIEARDKAGNASFDAPVTPINNLRAVPRGQIRDVRPATALNLNGTNWR